MPLLEQLGFKPYAKVNDMQAQHFANSLRRRLHGRDYAGAETVLANATHADRERLIYGVAASGDSIALASAWAQAFPNSAQANLMLGACLIVQGWEIRGGSYAEDVPDSAWKPFLKHLADAEAPLKRAAELDGALADPYAWLIQAGLAQDRNRPYFRALLDAANARVPLHGPTHYKYFSLTTEKWGGSHEEMFEFARSASDSAPAKHLIHILIPAAFNELALAVVSKHGVRRAERELRNRDYAAETVHAFCSWLDATPGTLADRLNHLRGGFAAHGLNQFAVALYLTGATEEARLAVDALRGEIESTPWAWIARGLRERANPAFVFDRFCRALNVPLQ